MTAAIRTEGLLKIFSPNIRAVDGVDLCIEEGCLFGYLGQNGSGKTTTIRMLTTLSKPTAGRAEVAGLDVLAHPNEVRQRIGVALQEAALDDLQTGRELLQLQARLYNVPGHQINTRVAELLRIVDLEDAADRRVGTYSGGMKRRLDLAAALVHRPKIIFLDEPTTGLDPISRDAIWTYVLDLNKNDGVTFFLTTQYLEEADRLADEVAIMDAGKIVAQGPPAELKSQIGGDVVTIHIEGGEEILRRAEDLVCQVPGVEDVHLVQDAVVIYIREGGSAIASIVLALNSASIQAGEISLTHPSLDDVFIRKTGHHLKSEERAAQPDQRVQPQ